MNMAGKADLNKSQPFPALSISNLEESILEEHTEGLFFDQNTVPFDFDGKILIWMTYLEEGVREIKSYTIETRQVDTLIRFTKPAGIISHVKIAKPTRNLSDALQIVYVQNTKDIVMYDTVTKLSRLIGAVSEPILAISVADR